MAFDDPRLGTPMAETLAPLLARAVKESGGTALVATATSTGKDVLPRVAALLGAGMASDIIRVDGPARFRRPAYAGNALACVTARETLRTLNRHFKLRTCTDHVLETRGRPCLQYQIKRCSGPCAIDVPPAAYAEQVEDVKMFLGGKSDELVSRSASANIPRRSSTRARLKCDSE